jgi:hypothetical protein
MEQESGAGFGCGRSLSVGSAVYATAGVGSDDYVWVRLHPDVLGGRCLI